MQNHLKKIAFFGGSFDPIHFGHLNIAIEMKERFGLDQVLFSPTPCSPFKLENPPIASLEHRSEMVKRAIDEIEGFLFCDVEAKFEEISYTIDALIKVKENNLEAQVFLILSDETFKNFDKWKDSDKILSTVDVLIGSRENSLYQNGNSNKIPKKNFIKMPILDISATEIRKRLEKDLYCGHLVNHKVLEYIDLHGLYHS